MALRKEDGDEARANKTTEGRGGGERRTEEEEEKEGRKRGIGADLGRSCFVDRSP